jgi:hypothetical protein
MYISIVGCPYEISDCRSCNVIHSQWLVMHRVIVEFLSCLAHHFSVCVVMDAVVFEIQNAVLGYMWVHCVA